MDTVIQILESTRKASGGDPYAKRIDEFASDHFDSVPRQLADSGFKPSLRSTKRDGTFVPVSRESGSTCTTSTRSRGKQGLARGQRGVVKQ